jgi:hypothetical protein
MTRGHGSLSYDEHDDDNGKFIPTFLNDAFLQAVGCECRTAYDRLNSLADSKSLTNRIVKNSLGWLQN